ncbi:sensor histidine kinase [Spirosoma foliorum]|uniref:Sensor histidine kinase n=1 Tax=Spirosoma foliorum TaxID=2710596 RepID=A0A7G5GS94_9BACT|nr:sensor histidine kinase [Spirosoma foliorum]QMW01736.1 sensor histidine kinase [Spirosoma foliorum]
MNRRILISRVAFFLFLFCLQAHAQSVSIIDVKAMNRVFVKPEPSTFRKGDSLIQLSYRHNNTVIYFQSPGTDHLYEYKARQLFSQPITTRDSFAVLSNLPNGELLFEVKDARYPNSRPARLKIIVESPLWLRWWFLPMMFLYGLVFVSAGLYLLYRYRLRQQLRLLSVRENIARDLHDDMGSYLSSISMLSQSVLNIAQKDPKHARLLVDKIGETARQVMDSMSDIVWSVNPENDSMTQVVVRMRDVATDLLGTQDITLHQDIDEAVPHIHLPLEQRRDFFLIYKEALTNIAKYASASHVWVRLQRSGSLLILVVQDDGVGFDTQQPVGQNPLGGNGLKNMHTRAQKLGGTLSIQSTRGGGTTLTLQILGV